jgi:hypothetical protein
MAKAATHQSVIGGTLKAGTTCIMVTCELLNEQETPAEDITEEVLKQKQRNTNSSYAVAEMVLDASSFLR